MDHFPGLPPITQTTSARPSLDLLLSQCSLCILPELEKQKCMDHPKENLKLFPFPHLKHWLKLTLRPCFFEIHMILFFQFSSVQSLSHVQLFATPWITARQASLSITNSWSLLKLMSIESVMPSGHLILCCPLLFLPLGCFYLWDTKYVFIPSPG